MTKSRSRKRKAKAQVDNLGPTPEQLAKGGYVQVETMTAGVKVMRNTSVDPISTYHKRGSIDDRQRAAAETFAAKFRKALLAEAYTMCRFGNEPTGKAPDNHLDAVHDATLHVRKALQYIGYPLASIIEHVVGNCHTAGSWRLVRGTNRPDQEGMVALRLALDGLAKYYRL